MSKALLEELVGGATGLGLTLSEKQSQQLMDFIALVGRWNKTHNLTAIHNPTDMVAKHLLDSLAISPFIDAERILDVGSGAGLPAIPLAIADPARKFVALDASQKRIAFIKQVIRDLKLANVEARHQRVEDFASEPFEIICSRAFSSLKNFVEQTGQLLAEQGRWYAMKGQLPEQEIRELPAAVHILEKHRLWVPGLAAERHLLVLARV